MKKNRIFFLIACVLTIVLATVSSYAIAQGRKNTYELSHWGAQTINEDIQMTAFYYAQELDPEFQPVTFSQEIDPQVKEQIENALASIMTQSKNSLTRDANFSFQAVYKKESADNLNKKTMKDPKRIGSAGFVDTTGFLETQIKNYLGWDYGPEIGYEINPLPKDYTFEYEIRSPLVNDGGYISSFIDYDSYMMPCILLAGLVPVAIIGLFVLLFPFKDERQAPVFGKAVTWKLEPFVVFNAILLTFLFMGVVLLSQASLMSDSSLFFNNLFNGKVHNVLYVLLGCVWSIIYASYFLILVYLKRIFCVGLARFIKEDTWIAGIIRWIGRKTDRLMQIDLAGHPIDRIVIALILTLLVVSFLFAIGPLGWLLAMAAVVYGFIKIIQHYRRIQKDYENTLEAARKIAAGEFDKVLPYPVGPFQSIYNTLLQVKNGFEIALKEGIQSQNMKTELISNVSHDLKTPLTGIKTYVELLETTDDIEQLKSYGKKIEGYTNRLDQLVVDLFDVSKANSGNISLEKQPVDLAALIEQVQAEHFDEWEKKDLQLVFKHPDHPVVMELDPNKTMRIFENLIGNVSKYAMDHTRVFVDIKEEPDRTTIVYRNISCQPLDFDPDQIVERFVRGDKSRHEIDSGLGLAIVKSFAEIQDGEFRIEIDGDLFKAIVQFKHHK